MFLVSMDSLVFLETVFSLERFVANGAFIRSSIRMNLSVLPQGTF